MHFENHRNRLCVSRSLQKSLHRILWLNLTMGNVVACVALHTQYKIIYNLENCLRSFTLCMFAHRTLLQEHWGLLMQGL